MEKDTSEEKFKILVETFLLGDINPRTKGPLYTQVAYQLIGFSTREEAEFAARVIGEAGSGEYMRRIARLYP